jgi:twitching motility protein PilT
MQDMSQLLQLTVDTASSDLHLITGQAPTLRTHGELVGVEGEGPLDSARAQELILSVLSSEQREFLEAHREIDLGYQFGEAGRFRVNVYYQRGLLGAAFRLIPATIRTLEELKLPPQLGDFIKYRQGLVLVTGPTGEGKSTTLAALIEEINATKASHILTIEDPIEFVYTPKKSIVSQREVNGDTLGWDMALRSALREDPDVVLVGELRDYETIASAVTVAETGHLVFATLHTSSAAQTIDRMIDVFPAHQQGQIRQQLAGSLQAVVSQRLLPAAGGGRIAALEIMLATPAVRNLIREGKTFQIDTVIQTSGGLGMTLMEGYLRDLVQRGAITDEVAREYSFRPDEYDRLTKGTSVST